MKALQAILIGLLVLPSLTFAEPAYVCRTKNRVVVVEATGGSTFKYTTWGNKQSMKDKPELVLDQGTFDVQGTGPCRTGYWIFKNGKYTYAETDSVACYESFPPDNAVGELSVSLNDQELSSSWCLKNTN